MPDQLGTVMYISRKSDDIRSVAVTRRSLLGLAMLAALAVVFAALVAFQLLEPRVSRPAGSLRLQLENRALLGELGDLEEKLAMLDGQMSVLLKRNEELRVVADLPSIPVEVTAVGVGGPGHEETAGLLSADPVVRRLSKAELDLDLLLRRSHLVARSMGEAEGIIRTKKERWGATPSIWPTDGFLSSPFSYARRHPLLGSFRPHYGIDISARAGNKVVATADGVVTSAGWRSGSGNHVEIDHGYGIATAYSHNARVLVKAGDRVRRGTPIGYVGSTGVSIGPHVHYEVRRQGQPVDPTKFIFPSAASD